MKLRKIDGSYAVAQLSADDDVPVWLNGPGLTAMVRTDDELTIVCDETRVPQDINAQRGWACFRSIGPFAFDEAGVVASLVAPISAQGIGVFVLCTFDGEHILCPSEHFAVVQDILVTQGHDFVD
ncbi:MAG: ACT domain-containing protein [Sulfitobacter sp.]